MKPEANTWLVICWGPIESLSNGYFIRTYSLIEKIVACLRRKVIVLEYTEDISKVESLHTVNFFIDNTKVMKILLWGNYKKCNRMLKYWIFVISQIANTIKLYKMFKKFKVVILCGELFLITLLLIKIIYKDKMIVISDPQMLLSELGETSNQNLSAFAFSFLEYIYFRLSNYIIAISENMRKRIIKEYKISEDRIIIIPHILPSKLKYMVSTDTIEKSDKKIDTINIAFVGSLYASHNFEAVLRTIYVISVIKRYIPRRLEFYIIGSTDERARLFIEKVSSELGVKDSIIMTGYVKDLDNFIAKKVDILIAPMFRMSGVSTKMLYYLRFKNKVIITSKKATEGLEHLVKGHNKVIVAENWKDFSIKLLSTILNMLKGTQRNF